MICPQCGKENEEGAKFCSACGFPIAYYAQRRNVKPSKVGIAVKAVAAVLLYIFIMNICQSCVTAGYMTNLMSDDVMSGEFMQSQEYMQSITDKVIENTVPLSLVSNLVTLLVLCLHFRIRRKKPVEEALVFGINPLRIFTFILLGVSLQYVVTYTLGFIPFPESLVNQFDTVYAGIGTNNIWLELFTVGIVTGVLEEFLFRGIAIKRLKAVSPAFAVVVSALLFGAAHMTPIAMLYSFLLGLLLGVICMKYNSAVPTMIVHASFNMTSYFVPENTTAVIVIYVLSIIALFVCLKLTFRYPVFNDFFMDIKGRIPARNETEARIINELHALNTSDSSYTEKVNEIEILTERWKENDRALRGIGYEEDDDDDDDSEQNGTDMNVPGDFSGEYTDNAAVNDRESADESGEENENKNNEDEDKTE